MTFSGRVTSVSHMGGVTNFIRREVSKSWGCLED